MEWKISSTPVPYPDALEFMDTRVAAIHAGSAPACVWLLEHPPLYTAGSSAKPQDLLSPRFEVYETGRGGQYTYHGPGQRVAYVMFDLKKQYHAPDLKRYIYDLEEWIIRTLLTLGVVGERRAGRVGIWVRGTDGRDSKIAAIGVRVRRGVTLHGIAINVNPDLAHFDGIIPCGIADAGVTSLHALGKTIQMDILDGALQRQFSEVFSET